MQGTVVRSTGSWYEVRTADGEVVSCRLKGVFRLEGSMNTNPVAVGDVVTIVKEENEEAYMITEIEHRRNYIVRKSPHHAEARQIIAANLDQLFLVATVANPRTSSGFIDRFLMTAEAYHIPTHLIFNKQDALDAKSEKKQEYLREIYTTIGYPVHLVSALKNENIEALQRLLHGKTTLFAGHSGVGKSTLLNTIEPGLQLRTKELSRVTGKGMHTTTFAEMFPLDGGTNIIDTPGVREFGVLDFQPEEISHYFIEMRKALAGCKFNNCTHQNEPNCAVKQAVIDGAISEERYGNYLNIIEDVQLTYKNY